MSFCRKLIKLVKRKCSKETREQKLARTPWEKDYKLQPASNTSLFYEYLEMGQCWVCTHPVCLGSPPPLFNF